MSAAAVLTAAHVVRDAARVRVRFNADRPGEWITEGSVAWSDPTVDAAVVAITPQPEDEGPVEFGRVAEQDAVLSCSAMGFPRFKLRNDPAHPPDDGSPSQYRDSFHAVGTIAVLSNRREGTLELSVPPPERDPDPQRSPWEGMSGAAVWSGGSIIGLISEHHRSDGLGKLAASRIDRWHERLTAQQVQALHDLIALPTRSEELAEVALQLAPEALAAARVHEARRGILAAELAASEVHPYRVPGDAPQLDQVYVEQWVAERSRPKPGAAPGQQSDSDPRPVPALQTVRRHRHVLLQGDPGQGKSTFTKHVAGTLAAAWLRGDDTAVALSRSTGIAVRVPAGDLSGDAPLAALLHASVRRRLRASITNELPQDLFERTIAGTRWLLLIDGLDEIIDGGARRQVVSAIAAHAAREDSPYRWVITTRALPANELELLLDAGLVHYMFRPFDDDQVRTLAARWLASGPTSEDALKERVEGFLTQVTDSGASQLVRTPLLAVIALVIYSRDPGQRLPTGRPGLYREFVTYLLSGREGEAARRAALERSVIEGGGTNRLADWLYQSRASLLAFLAERTFAGEARLQAQGLAWTREHAPDTVDFVHGWADIVATQLTGTGLLGRQDANGELQWSHRSFAEYLAARDLASRMPVDWPGQDPDRDRTFRDAVDGTRQELATLTIACWAEQPATSIEPLLRVLLDRSANYRVHAKHKGALMVFGDDSSQPDSYAALAGRLLAEGISVSETASDRVLERLVERAGSLFHGLEFSSILAAQPRREVARRWLLAMAADDGRPLQARCGAVVALARVFGFAAACAAAEPLLNASGPTRMTITDTDADQITSFVVSDGRVVVAQELAVLGEQVHALVRDLLNTAELANNDAMGHLIAAEAALMTGDRDRAIQFVASRNPDESDGMAVSILLRAGDHDAVKGLVARHMKALQAGDEWSTPGVLRRLKEIAESSAAVGELEIAEEIARQVLSSPSRDDAWPYVLLARCGDPGPGLDALHAAEAGFEDARMSVYSWVRLARALCDAGYQPVVLEVIGPLIDHRMLSAHDRLDLELGEFLTELGDARGQRLYVEAARDARAAPSVRRRAAEALLDTGDRQAAVEVLLELARRGLDEDRGSTDVAKALARVGAVQQAVALLRREIDDTIAPTRRFTDPWVRRRQALEALAAISPDHGRSVLREAVARGSISDRAAVDVARTLGSLGETAIAGEVLRRLVRRNRSVRWRRFILRGRRSSQAWTSHLVKAAELLARLGDLPTAIEACERVLQHEAKTGDEVEVDAVVGAAALLQSADRIGSRQLDALQVILTRARRAGSRLSIFDERGLQEIGQFLAAHGRLPPS